MKALPLTILEQQFPVPRNTATSKIVGGVISLLWQLRCHCNPDHKKFSFLSNTTVVTIFPNLCIWRRSLYSTLGGIDPEKLASSHLNTEELKFYILDSDGFYAKWLMVDGSSFFLIINGVIITSIPLFKLINVLNHFMILSASSYFSTMLFAL